jgi:hypothetical protein
VDTEAIPDSTEERARLLESILLSAIENKNSQGDGMAYVELRQAFIQDPVLKPLLPEFVRMCRDLGHFWPYIKGIDPQWAPRRKHVRDAMTPLFDHIEGKNKAPVDDVASDVLTKFDAEGVGSMWQKALARRHTDAEGAITAARTLLETVCKHILQKTATPYTDKDDLPTLYKATAKQLNLAPSLHTEEIFKQILGGATAAIEGLGALRNRISDAHGQGPKPVRPLPRHAQLAVNLAGALATFLIETWLAKAPTN